MGNIQREKEMEELKYIMIMVIYFLKENIKMEDRMELVRNIIQMVD